MATVGKMTLGLGVCVALLLALWAIFSGLSHAEEPAPSPCPPSPTLLDGSAPNAAASSAAPSTSPYQPSPEEIVACVGSQEISGATFSHWAVVADKADIPRSQRHPPVELNHALMWQVMGFLTSADWVLGEAAALHIDVSAAAVRRQLDHLRRQQFPKPAQFRAFLRSTGQTLGDLLFRVRLGMLTTRIQARVTGHGSARSKQRRLQRFIEQFKSKWKAQTYCQSLYSVPNCGHTAGSL